MFCRASFFIFDFDYSTPPSLSQLGKTQHNHRFSQPVGARRFVELTLLYLLANFLGQQSLTPFSTFLILFSSRCQNESVAASIVMNVRPFNSFRSSRDQSHVRYVDIDIFFCNLSCSLTFMHHHLKHLFMSNSTAGLVTPLCQLYLQTLEQKCISSN